MKVLQGNAQAHSDFACDIGVRVSSYSEARFVVVESWAATSLTANPLSNREGV